MKKYIISLLIIIFLLISLGAILFYINRQQQLRSQATPATTLSLEPSQASYPLGQEFTVDVVVDSGENVIASTDIVLNFDQQIFEAIDIENGGFLENITEIKKEIDNERGKLSFSFFTFRANAKSGKGTLAKATFVGKSSGTRTIIFDTATVVGGLGEQENVLVGTTPGSYTIVGGEAPTATPTPTPTEVPGAPPPTATPTSAPPAGPSPTQAPGPQPTTTPTQPPAPTPTTASVGGQTVVKLTSVKSGQTLTTARPTFSGTASPNAEINITIESPIIQGETTADSSGNWSWTPDEDIPDGSHKITIVATDSQGNQTTTSATFTISTSQPGELPETGLITPTVVLIISGILLLLSALIL